MLARTRWDYEVYNGETRMDMKDWPRGFHLPGYPAVIQLWRTPKGGEDRVPMNKAWLEFERAQNTRDKLFVIAYCAYNKQPPIPINDLPDDFVAYHENIIFSGNVVNVLERKNGSSRIETLYYKDAPPTSLPEHLLHQVTAIYNEDAYGNRYVHPGWNPDYSLVISRYREGVWVDDKWLDFTNEEPDMPDEPQYPDVYYQDFINAIYDTIQAKGIPGSEVWGYIKALGLEYLAVPDENRDTIITPE